jgi:hypothetical protein
MRRCMTRDICQRFLHDAVQGKVRIPRQLARAPVDAHVDGDSQRRPDIARQRLKRGQQSEFIEICRAQRA